MNSMKCFIRIFILSFLGLTAIAVMNTHSGQDDLIKHLTSGGHILMIRHAYAPGTGDPAHFKIGDCAT